MKKISFDNAIAEYNRLTRLVQAALEGSRDIYSASFGVEVNRRIDHFSASVTVNIREDERVIRVYSWSCNSGSVIDNGLEARLGQILEIYE